VTSYHRADRAKAKARLKRRGFPIHAYVGPNGTGKSAVMVYDTIPTLDAGRRVLSTVRLLDFRNPRPCELDPCPEPAGHELGHGHPHPCFTRLTKYEQLIEAKDCDVLLDEVVGVAGSREGQSMPVQVQNVLVQMRRKNIALRWSAPAWARADTIIREVSQAATLMWAAAPKVAPPSADGSPKLWMQKRLFLARTYDPTVLDEFEAHRADKIAHEVKAYYWGPGALMFEAYDTLDPVTTLGWANEAGLCLGCGGKRTIPKCICSDQVVPARAVRSVQPVLPAGLGEVGA